MEIFCFGWEGAGLPALTSRGTVAERVRNASGIVGGRGPSGDPSRTNPATRRALVRTRRDASGTRRGPVGDPSGTRRGPLSIPERLCVEFGRATRSCRVPRRVPTGPRRIPDGSRRVPTGLDGWSGRAGGRATRGGMRGQERGGGGGWGRANFPVGISEI